MIITIILVGLGGADLEAAGAVDAEANAVLGELVEDRRRGPQRLVEHVRRGHVLGARLEGAARRGASEGLQGLLAARDLELGGPGGREELAGVAHHEVGAAEVLQPAAADGLLLLHQAAQLGDVGRAGVRGHEGLAVHVPVGQVGVEDAAEQLLVVLCEDRVGLLQHEEEVLGDVRHGALAAPAAGDSLRRHLRRLVQAEVVEVEVHSLGRREAAGREAAETRSKAAEAGSHGGAAAEDGRGPGNRAEGALRRREAAGREAAEARGEATDARGHGGAAAEDGRGPGDGAERARDARDAREGLGHGARRAAYSYYMTIMMILMNMMIIIIISSSSS